MTPLALDRLRIFVSSTIQECASERANARGAITSLNHEPILFENIGARAHPPPDVYRARIDISHIFVAIYRESYGWIAPDMDISGIDDEFRHATARGLDRLVYVYQTPTSRDSRLQVLINRAKTAGIVVAPYTDPTHLADRLRNDLTATISGRFLDRARAHHAESTASDVLTSLLPNPQHRLRRPALQDHLVDTLQSAGRVLVTAPLGGGKTVLTAQASEENGWLFLDGQHNDSLPLLARAANRIRQHLALPGLIFTSEHVAAQELLTAWERAPHLTLAVDGARDPLRLWQLVPNTRRLVVTSRQPFDVPSRLRCEIPHLTPEEGRAWLAALFGRQPNPAEVAKIVARSRGNPLYLRFLALEGDAAAELTLRELEMRAVRSLPARPRELISYLAISPRPLSLADLTALLQPPDGAEAVAAHLAAATGVVNHRGGVVDLVHEHFRETLSTELHQDATRLSFFASRLGRHFEECQDHVAAFHVYLAAKEQRHADRVLRPASYQASLMGGGAPAVPIFRRQADLAAQRGSPRVELHASLDLTWSLLQIGAKREARAALDRARTVAERHPDDIALLRVREVEVTLGADDRSRGSRIGDLERLRELYVENSDLLGAGRVGTLLTVEYISSGEHRTAARLARELVELFEGLDNEYGRRIARLNLASALSGIPGEEGQAAALTQELEHEIVPERYPRERAVICNYLARQCRRAGRPDQAEEFALEALRIGEGLGNAHVIAINRTTLGNIRRDQGKSADALVEYHSASQAAVAGGVRDAEAAATELIASVHNDQMEHGRALFFARHAGALARLVGDQELAARAEEERARAHAGLNELHEAVAAYATAARAIGVNQRGGAPFVQLLVDGLHLCDGANRRDLAAELLSGVFLAPESGSTEREGDVAVLYGALSRVADDVAAVEHILAVVALAVSGLVTPLPAVVQRRVVLQSVACVTSAGGGGSWKGRSAAVAAILMSQDGGGLTLGDMVDIGGQLAEASPSVYFRPYEDGAAQWTLRLDIGGGAIVAVQQLDDDPRTARVAAVLALLLDGFDGPIGEGLLDVESLPRDEATIMIASRLEAETQFGADLLPREPMTGGFLVSESRDISRGDQPPMLVVREEEFPSAWHPTEKSISDMHLLLGQVLERLVPHFLAEAVEPEVLHPKVVEFIRRVGCAGPSA